MASAAQVTAVMAPSRAPITAPALITAPAPIVHTNVPAAPIPYGYYAAPQAPARAPKPTSATAWIIAGVGAVALVMFVVALVLALAFLWSP